MIQAPTQTYMQPMQPMQMMQNNNQGAVNTQQAQQVQQQPGVFYNYPVASCYQPQMVPMTKSQYNGVNIEIINPQGQGMPCGVPAQWQPVQQPVYMPVQQAPYQTMQQPAPYVTSQATVNPPVQQAPAQVITQTPAPVVAQTPAPVIAQPTATTPAPVQTQVPAPVVVQQETTPVAVPEPQIKSTPTVQQPTNIDSKYKPESFAARLNSTSGLAQKDVIEEIATLVATDDTVAPLLLDTQIFDSLVSIINQDTTALQGPTADVIALRQKPETELTQAELAKANEQSPLEIAEQNKQYALFTISFMQNRLNSELEKRNNPALELKDLPCIDVVVNAVKSNPNPNVRVAGLSALAQIARPEYKADLTTIFELAKADEDPSVQTSAANAIQKINA